MTRILFIDRFNELNYADVTFAYVSCFQDTTRLVCGSSIGWDMPRQDAEHYVELIARAKPDEVLDLRSLGKTQ